MLLKNTGFGQGQCCCLSNHNKDNAFSLPQKALKKQCFCVSVAIFFLKLRHCFNPVIAGKGIAIGWTPDYARYLMTVI
jgi:hypothetical protein